jgi:hypothetical protein
MRCWWCAAETAAYSSALLQAVQAWHACCLLLAECTEVGCCDTAVSLASSVYCLTVLGGFGLGWLLGALAGATCFTVIVL